MTQIITLQPCVREPGSLEPIFGLDIAFTDNFPELEKLAETLGTKIFERSFPGEPKGITADIRYSLWCMLIRSNLTARRRLLNRFDKLCISNVDKKSLCAVATLISGLGIASWIGMQNYHSVPSLIVATLCFAASLIINFSSGKKAENVFRLLHVRCSLQDQLYKSFEVARSKSVSLSSELQILQDLVNEGRYENWHKVSPEDKLAMCELSFSLLEHEKIFSEGVHLKLSGEYSELLYRVCSDIHPNRMESLMQEQEDILLSSIREKVRV